MFTAQFANLALRQCVFFLFSKVFFNLLLNRQTMTVPTWNVTYFFTKEIVGFNNHIFENFVECMSNVNMPVGIGRAIVKNKCRWGIFSVMNHFCISALLFGKPLSITCRLVLREVTTHWKIGLRKKQGLFIVHLFISPWKLQLFTCKRLLK